jgi:hypothetical protein
MSRLLFAAARGARILYGSGRLPTDLVSLEEDAVQFIHQDDEHLQYGTISTAYRAAAEHPPMWPDVFMDNVGYLITPSPMTSYYKKLSPIGKQFYLLLFSEYLADEGL